MARSAVWSRSLSRQTLAHTSVYGRLIYTVIYVSDSLLKKIQIPV